MLCASAKRQIDYYFGIPIFVAVISSIFGVRSLFTGLLSPRTSVDIIVIYGKFENHSYKEDLSPITQDQEEALKAVLPHFQKTQSKLPHILHDIAFLLIPLS